MGYEEISKSYEIDNQQPRREDIKMPLAPITKEEYETRIRLRFPEESFTILKYESLGKPAVLQCNNCNFEIKVSVANNFLAKNKVYGCVHCHGLWIKRQGIWEEIKQRYFFQQVGVQGTHKFYEFTCKRCGHKRYCTFGTIRANLECGCITGVFRRTEEELKEQLAPKYTLVGDFKGMAKKTLIKCNICGFLWSVRPADVLYSDASCPHCNRLENSSKGERFIEDYLMKRGIEFQREFPLQNSKQRFDFFLPKNNIAIEYNGKQHYKFIKHFHHTNQGFKKMKERDKRKREYCENNRIRLLEIPYSWKDETIVAFLDSNLRFNDYPIEE